MNALERWLCVVGAAMVVCGVGMLVAVVLMGCGTTTPYPSAPECEDVCRTTAGVTCCGPAETSPADGGGSPIDAPSESEAVDSGGNTVNGGDAPTSPEGGDAGGSTGDVVLTCQPEGTDCDADAMPAACCAGLSCQPVPYTHPVPDRCLPALDGGS